MKKILKKLAGGMLVLAILFVVLWDPNGEGNFWRQMHRSFCRHTLQEGVRVADAVYELQITNSNLIEKEGDHTKYYSCAYDVELGKALKQPFYNRMFGAPKMVQLKEDAGRGSSFDAESFWSEGASCRPPGNYLLIVQIDRLKQIQKRQMLGNCNHWAIISDSYKNDVQKLIENDKN